MPATAPPPAAAPASAAAWRLLGDIGATHARLALQRGPGAAIEAELTLPCAQFETLEAALAHYLALQAPPLGPDARPRLAALAVAGPVQGDWVQLTNHAWAFSSAALRQRLGLERLEVLNDFTALALALPLLRADETLLLGGHASVGAPAAPLALIGPGSGLGVSGLLPDGRGGWLALAGEGGHATLAASNADEAAVLQLLRQRYGHASAERALSGPGLEALYAALAELRGLPAAPTPSAAQIGSDGLNGPGLARDAMQLFCALLGSVAGNLALTLGARGGVFLGGGILPRWGDFLPRSAFMQRFAAKGRLQGYLEQIPVRLIRAASAPALRGAAAWLERVR